MALGNIGNLLQHFIALKVAQRVVATWNKPNEAIEYIDCFSMAPWKPITGGQPQGFVSAIRSFVTKAANGDFVAQAFLQAWRNHYGERAVPDHPMNREYPNTALLLASSFPNQQWTMRLHENDFAEVPVRIVQRQFKDDWNIEHVRSGTWKLRGRDSYHQGWIVSQNVEAPGVGTELQAEWDRWYSLAEVLSRRSIGADHA